MKTSLELNGNYRLRIKPENAVEQAFLEGAATLSEKGATTILAKPKTGSDEAFTLEIAMNGARFAEAE